MNINSLAFDKYYSHPYAYVSCQIIKRQCLKISVIVSSGARNAISRYLKSLVAYDMKRLVFKLDLMIDGAKALMDSGILKKQVRISSRGKHLGGKTIDGGEVLQC